jgi:hypothetical protein
LPITAACHNAYSSSQPRASVGIPSETAFQMSMSANAGPSSPCRRFVASLCSTCSHPCGTRGRELPSAGMCLQTPAISACACQRRTHLCTRVINFLIFFKIQFMTYTCEWHMRGRMCLRLLAK